MRIVWIFISVLGMFMSCNPGKKTEAPAIEKLALEGVFLESQAQSGGGIYAQHCATCHGADLRGTEGGVALLGDRFISKWQDSTAYSLMDLTRNTMPKSNANALSDGEYEEIMAFILSKNNFPAGNDALTVSGDLLHTIAIGTPPAPARRSLQFIPGSTDEKPITIEADWRHHRGNPGSTNYAPLEQINASNVQNLKIAWRWKTDNFGPSPEYYFKVTPLMANGKLYTTAGSSRSVAALNAETGETLWTFRLDEKERQAFVPRQNSGRGVAYWTAPQSDQDRIIYITPGYQLVALNAETGRPIAEFGKNGVVDLKKALGPEIDPITATVGSTSPPIVVNDVIVVGSAFPTGLAPASKKQARGDIMGFDVRSGKKLWTFHTIPQPGEAGNETWEKESWSYSGNVGAWAPLSADPELGYVYLPLEAATGDFYGGHRPGNNLYSGSLVCLNAKTGRKVWHYQLIHHDIWDYDLPTAPILADIKVGGQAIKAVVQLTKHAFAFVFDRVTGQPVWPIEERPVPASVIPGEYTSPTQPFPTKPAAYDLQGYSEDVLVDFTPEIKQKAIEIASKYRKGPLFTPVGPYNPKDNLGTLMLPDAVGGANWQGGVFDPETGMLYVSSSTVLRPMSLEPGNPELTDMDYVAYLGNSRIGPYGLPLVKPPYGRITAINLNTGVHEWMIANADTPEWIKNIPALKNVTLPRTGTPDRAGLLVTKTLLFAGEGSGLYVSDGGGGNKFRAQDKKTGKILAELELPANQAGIPMTYSINGKQYIVVAVGAAGHPGELVALAL